MNSDHKDLEKIEDGLSKKLIYRKTEKENTKIIIDFSKDKQEFKNLKELEELDFFENLNNNITFIEWPEMLISLPLNKKYYLINLDIISETKRKINISFNQ